MSISDKLYLPKDVVNKASLVHILGQFEIYVENYRNIIEYTNELIYIQGKVCKIRISGKNMQILYFSNSDMKISGKIEKIEYI